MLIACDLKVLCFITKLVARENFNGNLCVILLVQNIHDRVPSRIQIQSRQTLRDTPRWHIRPVINPGFHDMNRLSYHYNHSLRGFLSSSNGNPIWSHSSGVLIHCWANKKKYPVRVVPALFASSRGPSACETDVITTLKIHFYQSVMIIKMKPPHRPISRIKC